MLYLSQQVCKGCGLKLTEYEIKEKDSHCMECYNDKNKTASSSAQNGNMNAVFEKRMKTRRYAWYYHHASHSAK